ncbi:MAG TPA: NIPSNAP family protein [Burkholderiales bacterium]|nr:NIPSNAP family protein [Burkholderiales bacterium]
MIYEMRTYDIKPRSLPEVEKRFGEAYEKRKKYSELAAFWHTEIGPLNQIIHVWGYKDLQEREQVRAAAVKDGAWPPKIAEFIVSQKSEIFTPFSFMKEFPKGSQGPFFEIRTYHFAGGELPVIKKNWENAIAVRLEFGPVTAVWNCELGKVNTFQHIWPYKSLDEREEIRKKATATGLWPAGKKAIKEGGRDYELIAQENKIVMPSSFSPLQ